MLDWLEVKQPTKEVIEDPAKFKSYLKNLNGKIRASHHRPLPEAMELWMKEKCSAKHASRICYFSRELSIGDEKLLNNYRPHSAETYGETALNQLLSICEELEVGTDDIFADLGSGVGQTVLFLSAFAGVKKSIGFEIMQYPSKCAELNRSHFISLMKHLGKAPLEIKLIHGSFLDAEAVELITSEATLLFMNNVKFDPPLMLNSENLFKKCKVGTRIISTSEFVNRGRSPEASNAWTSQLASITSTKKLRSVSNNVSWTGLTQQFYLTTIHSALPTPQPTDQ